MRWSVPTIFFEATALSTFSYIIHIIIIIFLIEFQRLKVDKVYRRKINIPLLKKDELRIIRLEATYL